MRPRLQPRCTATVALAAILAATAPIIHANGTTNSCWSVESKRFTPIRRAADVVLLPGAQKVVAAMELDSDLLITFDASSGQILTRFGLRESSPQCLLLVGDRILLVQDKNRGPEVRSFAVADLKEDTVIPLADFRLYRIASAALSRNSRYVWLSSARTSSSLYGHINSALFRLDLQTRECSLILGVSKEPVIGRHVPNLAQPVPSDNCWQISSAASGEVLVSDIHTNKLMVFDEDATEPSRIIHLPFIPHVMPRECGRILPVAASGRIALVNLEECKVTNIIEIKGNPLTSCVSSDGSRAFFSFAGSNGIVQINLLTGSLLPDIDFSRTDGRHDLRDSARGYDTFNISTLRWADNPARLIGLGYDGYILMIAELVQDQDSNINHAYRQQMASRQIISCTFTAIVLKLTLLEAPLPPDNKLKGYLIDQHPKWEVELDVLPHDKKIPFQPGVRKCYIADVQNVFNSPPDKVQGKYEFSFVWNVDVPGQPGIKSFKALKK